MTTNTNINISFKFTEQAMAFRFDAPGDRFSVEGGIPLPNVGDHIEFGSDTVVQPFLVIERVFSFQRDGAALRILLDLPR